MNVINHLTRLKSETTAKTWRSLPHFLGLPSLSSHLTTKTHVNLSSKEQSLMSLFKRCSTMKERGDMDYGVSVFENIDNPDRFLWNTMIRGFGKSGQFMKAFEYYKRMQQEGFLSDNFTFSFLLKACGQLGSLVLGQQMHCSTVKHGLESNTFVRNTVMHMYGMVKDVDTASHLFEEIPRPELVAWNTILDCHVCSGKCKEALDLFLRMLRSGIEPDEATFLVTLSACSALGALDFGRWLHSCIRNTSLSDIISVSNSLIDMYAKCGAVEEAYETFDKIKEKNIVSWNTMILGLASHGYANEAVTLFSKMLEENLQKPNGVSLLGVLCACSHGGMVDEGRRYFDMMSNKFHIKPNIKHYGCMVDILGRAGLAEEAYRLIRSMPIKCNAVVWRTLLAACRVHGSVELGEKVRRHLLELEPDHSSDYVLLANMFASVGQWSEVMRVRRSMWERRVQKPQPGNSVIGIAPGRSGTQ